MNISRASIWLPTAIACGFLAKPVVAQETSDLIEKIQAQITTQRQTLVAENIELTDSESEKFWPLYREFQEQRAPLISRRFQLLSDFRDNFDGLSDAEAKEIIDRWLALEDDIVALRKQYVIKFRGILPEKKALRYFQVELKLDTIIDYDLAQVVPLAE